MYGLVWLGLEGRLAEGIILMMHFEAWCTVTVS